MYHRYYINYDNYLLRSDLTHILKRQAVLLGAILYVWMTMGMKDYGYETGPAKKKKSSSSRMCGLYSALPFFSIQ